ncbi:UNVERIFIED_CONTAM: hypothetical protein Scaly_3141900 [Sesamum calycinum]|uniref:Uncharacterized protein n=1 Tax=Sesamum calycinum TaxID=2727403 RepID=A0AAW2JGT2_9LAMI
MKSFWIPDSSHSGPLASLALGQICLGIVPSLRLQLDRKSKIDVERQAEKELVCKVGMNWESQEKDLENLTYGTENSEKFISDEVSSKQEQLHPRKEAFPIGRVTVAKPIPFLQKASLSYISSRFQAFPSVQRASNGNPFIQLVAILSSARPGLGVEPSKQIPIFLSLGVLCFEFSLGSPIAVRLKRQRKRWILFWVEGDDPNESTIKGAVSYISTKIPSPEQSHIRKSLSLRYPSVITKRSGKRIAAIESKQLNQKPLLLVFIVLIRQTIFLQNLEEGKRSEKENKWKIAFQAPTSNSYRTGILSSASELTGSNYQQWRRQQEHHKKERAEISPAAEVATSKPVSGPVGFVDSAIEVVRDSLPFAPSCEIEEIRKMKIVSPGRFIEPPSVFAVDRQLHANMLLTFSSNFGFSAENPAAVSPIDRIDHPVEVVAKSVVSPDPEPDSGPAFSPVG